MSPLVTFQLLILIRFVTVRKYTMWYRHTGDPRIQQIPDVKSMGMRKLTLEQICDDISNNDITHMCITGEIPPTLSRLTPNLKQIKLMGIEHADQLE